MPPYISKGERRCDWATRGGVPQAWAEWEIRGAGGRRQKPLAPVFVL
jgi:hypothetical protein